MLTSRRVSFAILVLAAVGCGDFGEVEQGRVVGYDEAGATVTVVCDSNPKGKPPRYNQFPPQVVRLPARPGNMGKPPVVGHLLAISREQRAVVTYDPVTQTERVIPALSIDWKDGVWPDDAVVRKADLPLVDPDGNTVTTYLPRERVLAKITIPAEYSRLPRESWIPGDEVRYYYKSRSEAIRMMNLTRFSTRQ